MRQATPQRAYGEYREADQVHFLRAEPGPNRSPSRPVVSSGTVLASKYALVTQITLL
ncbi:drug resistance transporter, EmrB/QacA subfamily domain protein [Mycobacterium ulcerans str. Harvey]|uniref:Drug resistance transporter, EmrB/QacA subfamily domain protein n=1 Tax=Mycobacterium ulcerans str. Harvey TaxID=1299332 RepID=A0ABP3AC23_MYCUL|nr:drug resistance transporter, EmrB/QacA subfamily domain protein [Mycobacterium ulcerans str. Harvey]